MGELKVVKSLNYRLKTVEKIKEQEFDVLVIGGGITGAGIARDAQLRGYTVVLVEKEDFGFGTSSGSSKLVHAGLRYLSQKEFRLVRESSVERKRIIEMTPHLTRPLPFLVPLHSDTKLTKSKIRVALWLYDILAGFKNYGFHKLFGRKRAQELLPRNLRENNLQGVGYYFDGQMDDARLTLDVILSAQHHGCTVLNYAEVTRFSTIDDRVSSVTVKNHIEGGEFSIQAKTIIIATGHWNDNVIRMIDQDSPARIRPTKGIHIIVKRFYDQEKAVVVPVKDGRIIFIVPFGSYNLIGTTDTDYSGDLDQVPVIDEDVDYLVQAINEMFPGSFTISDVVSAYSGIRPLVQPDKSVSESDIPRTHRIDEILSNTYSIAGGKYTTYRQMAEDIVDRLEQLLGKKKPCRTKKTPYYGWNQVKRTKWDEWATKTKNRIVSKFGVDEDVANHLLRYGIHYPRICEMIASSTELKKRVSPSRPYILAEIDYFIKFEHTVTLNDTMLRRTQIQLSDNQGLDCVEVVAKRMGEVLGWSEDKIREEVKIYRDSLVWKQKG
ncbi:MAG: glycerol-3-phosphate dehydrogenase [Candidatus Hodarchaeales archaeon]|jgi:glycerol-3-phosphate dehydrogenase